MKRLFLFLIGFIFLLSGTANSALVEGNYPFYGPGSWSSNYTAGVTELFGNYGWYSDLLNESLNPTGSGWSDGTYWYQPMRVISTGTLDFDFPDNPLNPGPFPSNWHHYTVTGSSAFEVTIKTKNGVYAGIADEPFTGEFRGKVTDETLTAYNILFSTENDEDNFYLDPNTNRLLSHDGSILNSTLDISAVPIPAAIWLFGSGLIGLVGITKRRKKTATIVEGD